MLYPCPIIKFDIFLYLRFLAAICRFVDGKLYTPIAVAHYLAHKGGIFRRNVLVVKRDQLCESHDMGIKLAPLVHFVPSYITYNMIHISESGRWRGIEGFPRYVTWHKNTTISPAFHKTMDRFTVGMYSGKNHFPMVIP